MKLYLIFLHLIYNSFTTFCYTTIFWHKSASNILSSIPQLENAQLCHLDALFNISLFGFWCNPFHGKTSPPFYSWNARVTPTWLAEEHDSLAATAHLSLAKVCSRVERVFVEWTSIERETRNTRFLWVFTDVYWQQRNKKPSLSFQPKRKHALIVSRHLLLQPASYLPCSSSPVPERPPFPFPSSFPAHISTFVYCHPYPVSCLLYPHTLCRYVLAIQHLGQIPGLVEAGEKLNSF